VVLAHATGVMEEEAAALATATQASRPALLRKVAGHRVALMAKSTSHGIDFEYEYKTFMKFLLAATVAILIIGFSYATIAVAWTAPTQSPPNGNVSGPLNISSTGQVKAGSLWAASVGADSGYCIGGSCITAWPVFPWAFAGANIYYTSGNIGIGTASPVVALDVTGPLRLTPYTSVPATCDASRKGSIAIASFSSRICTCNGSSWVFNYNGTACSWGTGDTTPPTVSITAPSNGATVTGTIAVNATASDNVGVVGVQFKLDGANLGAEDTTSPYSTSWSTTGSANGSHTLTAVARDAAGNTTTSAAVTVTVPDTVSPTVSINTPSNGATVSGTTAVSATASDNIGVVGVQFKLDGANLGAEDTTSPYSTSWNTTSSSNGSHTLTAVARDAAGNQTTSAVVSVTVNNVVPGSYNYTAAGSYNFTVPAYNTLTVRVWGGGGGGSIYAGGGNGIGGTGGQSSWNGTVIAGGGGGGSTGFGTGTGGPGGAASGGDVITNGNLGQAGYSGVAGAGGSAPNGGAGGAPTYTVYPSGHCPDCDGAAPGGGGGGGGYGSGGGSGAYAMKQYSAGQLTVGAGITVVVGGGSTGNQDNATGRGAAGGVYIEWN